MGIRRAACACRRVPEPGAAGVTRPLPGAPPIPDVTAKAVTAVRLPLEMWKEELLDDTPMAAEEESDPYEAPTDTP